MAQVEQNEDDIVVLEFENSSIPCSKKVLVDNSDYFKTMFGGSFLEHQQKVIKIHVGVQFTSKHCSSNLYIFSHRISV